MPRIARVKSSTGYYHIMMRGVDRRKIFDTNNDYRFFIFLLKKYSEELEASVIAYCLMTNHFHLLVQSDNTALLIKKISAAYVKYYNKKNNRIGHLFQERFKSEAVENDSYLLTVTRYILNNPQKAGMASFDKYPWNSWQEFIYPDFCDTKIIIDILGGESMLIDFMTKPNNDKCIDLNDCKYMNSDEVTGLICRKLQIDNVEQLKDFSKEKLNSLFQELKEDGFTSVQISQATGVGKYIIMRA